MKSKTIPFAFLFVAILIVGAFFLSKSVFFSEDKDVVVKANSFSKQKK